MIPSPCETAICIASGPSLRREDVDYCRGKGRVYVVNDCWRLAPWADVLYACDGAWWEHYRGAPEFRGEKWTIDAESAKKYGLRRVKVAEGQAWSQWESEIATGKNSGFQALNLAAVQNFPVVRRVVLLGYDMQRTGGRKHWFGDHPGKLNREIGVQKWIKAFRKAAPLIHVPVINCTRETALDCFPRARLDEVL